MGEGLPSWATTPGTPRPWPSGPTCPRPPGSSPHLKALEVLKGAQEVKGLTREALDEAVFRMGIEALLPQAGGGALRGAG
jgi:ABC-2 type transport system ATP-binding protein